MSHRTLYLNDALHEYIRQVSLRESTLLQRLRDETAGMEGAVMQISPEQGQFMHVLVKSLGVRKAIEVGVYTGYSSLCVASALSPQGTLLACDIHPGWTAVAQRYWQEAGVAQRIDLRLAPAVQTLKQLLSEGHAGTFDFAFIDADKTNYLQYYDLCLELLRTGGVILVDNVLWSGAVIDRQQRDPDTVAIREFNDLLSQDPRVDISMLPIGDGLTYLCKR